MRNKRTAGRAEKFLHLAAKTFGRTNFSAGMSKALFQAVPLAFDTAQTATEAPIVNLSQKAGDGGKKLRAASTDAMIDTHRLNADKIKKAPCFFHAVFYSAANRGAGL